MLTGSCHCGRVRFKVQGTPEQAIECNCSHCSRKGFLLWSVAGKDFELSEGADRLSTYTFYKHQIKHRFCPNCGTQPFAVGSNPETGEDMVAVNIRCLEDFDFNAVPRVPVDGKSF